MVEDVCVLGHDSVDSCCCSLCLLCPLSSLEAFEILWTSSCKHVGCLFWHISRTFFITWLETSRGWGMTGGPKAWKKWLRIKGWMQDLKHIGLELRLAETEVWMRDWKHKWVGLWLEGLWGWQLEVLLLEVLLLVQQLQISCFKVFFSLCIDHYSCSRSIQPLYLFQPF